METAYEIMFESAFMKPKLSQDEAVESNLAVYAAGQLLLGWSVERWWSRMMQWGDAGA